MKTGLIALLLLTAFSASSQSFLNLNFEQAHPVSFTGPPYYPNQITESSALPHWIATVGGVQQDVVTENAPSTGAPWVSIITGSFEPLDGNYSVFLQGTGSSDAAINQTGLIPVGMESLTFEAESVNRVGPLQVSIGGQVLSFYALNNEGPYTVYGADISAWAGQMEQLSVDAINGNWVVDDISFSPNAVPEPGPFELTAVGGLFFTLYRRFAFKRK